MADNCTTSKNHSKIKVEENKRQAVFINKERIEYKVSRVDGCLIPRGETAADYLVVKPESTSVLVELKGKDVQHACDQLFSSVENSAVKPFLERKIGFLVVCSRYPRFDTFVAKAKQIAAKKYRAGFHVIAENREYDIEKCAAIEGPN